MLAIRSRLSHSNIHFSTSACIFRLQTKFTNSKTQCHRITCMSLVRPSTTLPEPSKRRKLSRSSPNPSRSFTVMAPALIQEVEDDQPTSDLTPPTVSLTGVEQTLERLLLNVAEYIDETPSPLDAESQVALPPELAKQKLVLRFAGGWVRDKLLGVQTQDIDVSINKMTGYHFGLRLKEYLEIPGNLEKYGLESIAANDKQSQKAGTTDKSKTVGGLHKIEANPEKSKNLETTTMRILGLDIDLVNLRKETYSDDSRNPTIEFGTAEEDAIRRDANVNALFYNINTGLVEDLTGKGLDDMRNKVLRTPLDPHQTFKDDPLRVLRLIRFASRLGYTIDEDVLSAMRGVEIKDALRRKISRERVGIEIEKSLHGPDPHGAMQLISDLGLYETIFSDPNLASADHHTPDTEGWHTIIGSLADILSNGGVVAESLARDKEERFLAWQMAILVPYRDAPEPEAPEPGRKALPPFAVQVAREGIKATSKTCDVISAAVRNQSEISNHVDRLFEVTRRPDKVVIGDDPSARDILGMLIRKWGVSWRSQVMYSMLVGFSNEPEHIDAIERKYSAFIDRIRSLNLLDVCSLKPVIDGKVLIKALNTPSGPWMKDALEVVMAWQLRNPDIKDPQSAIEEVKNHRQNGELTANLIRHFLKLTIRPIFIKATPSSVTDQGRKVSSRPLPKKMTVANMDDQVNKPWKSSKDAYSLDLLRWVIQSLDETNLEDVWPLVIPPVLTLIDDWEEKYKTLGVEFLQSLLQVTPLTILQKTGLGEVFEEALMPCLTYVPTITPEDESITLLSAVYPCLLTLALVRYPRLPVSDTMSSSLNETDHKRIHFLDALLRQGIISGCAHCSAYPRILSLLYQHLVTILDLCGIDSVKHLKFILPILTDTLSHPLAGSSMPLLLSATAALEAVIRNAWPRMTMHRAEVLKAVTLCWIRHAQRPEGHEQNPTGPGVARGSRADAATNEDAVAQLRARLQETVDMLAVAVRAAPNDDADFDADCAALIAAEPRLRTLFRAEAAVSDTVKLEHSQAR